MISLQASANAVRKTKSWKSLRTRHKENHQERKTPRSARQPANRLIRTMANIQDDVATAPARIMTGTGEADHEVVPGLPLRMPVAKDIATAQEAGSKTRGEVALEAEAVVIEGMMNHKIATEAATGVIPAKGGMITARGEMNFVDATRETSHTHATTCHHEARETTATMIAAKIDRVRVNIRATNAAKIETRIA